MNKFDVFSNKFAHDIFLQKYSMNGQETWADTCKRVINSVCGSYLTSTIKDDLYSLMYERKFIPGGRYLYSSGRPYHQISNCFVLRAEDSREGWGDLMSKATMALMGGGGIGVCYNALRPKGTKIYKTGGEASGPLALMHMINEAGRYIQTGGNRRSAIFGSLLWSHPDIEDFLTLKNWTEEQKKNKENNFLYPLPMDGTNISVDYDTEFFIAIERADHPNHELAKKVWKMNCTQAFSTGEPGFMFNFLKDNENLRNAPVSGETSVLTDNGYKKVKDIINQKVIIWTGQRWSKTEFKKTKINAPTLKIIFTGRKEIVCSPEHEFILNDKTRIKARDLQIGQEPLVSLGIPDGTHEEPNAYLLGCLYGDGSFHKKYPRAELPLCGKKKLLFKRILNSAIIPLSYKNDQRDTLRIYYGNNELFKNRKKSLFPQEIFAWNKQSRQAFLEGLLDTDGNDSTKFARLSSIHFEFLKEVGRLAESLGFTVALNISSKSGYCNTLTWNLIIKGQLSKLNTVRLKLFDCKPIKFKVVSVIPDLKQDVFCCDVGVSEHSFQAEGIIISNCTEVVSEEDSDKCNLGTIWISRFSTRDEFAKACDLVTKFLLCGNLYSDYPYPKIKEVGLKSNRIGVGLGGIHEWLILNGFDYECTPELHKWLNVYEQETNSSAYLFSKDMGLPVPKGKRAIAPTGCQVSDTLIVSSEGIYELGELGEMNGTKWQPLNLPVAQETKTDAIATKFFINGKHETKKIFLSSGLDLECTLNHKYRVLENGDYIWKCAKDIVVGDLLVTCLGGYTKITEPILFCPPKQHYAEKRYSFPEKVTPKLAEFLGIFFGDGSIHRTGIRIACNVYKPEEVEYVAKLGQELFNITPSFEDNGRGCMAVCFTSVFLLRWLYLNGFNKTKCQDMEITTTIRTFSKESLEAFLNGYWFADGSYSVNPKTKKQYRYIDTSSPKMAKQLLVIYRALGFNASIQRHTSGMGFQMYRVRPILTKNRNHTALVDTWLNNLNLKNCTVDKVVEIKSSINDTYDIEVPTTNTYIANGVVSHNTLSILAETTSGIEPLFCKAYKRRYLKDGKWMYQYVIDGAVKRLIDKGIPIEKIKDSYDLTFEQRVKFQADVQNYIDQAISSTANLAPWNSDTNNSKTLANYSKLLLKYAKRLRGFTCYPDGARGGQPLTKVSLEEAFKHEGRVFEETEGKCINGVCGL